MVMRTSAELSKIGPNFSNSWFSVNLTAETNRVKAESAGLEPIELAPDIKVEPTPIYSQVDQKAKLYTPSTLNIFCHTQWIVTAVKY